SEISSFIESGPYIHFDNAYVDICDLDYLPCNGEVMSICPHKGLSSWKHHVKKKSLSKKCFAKNELVNRIYHESIANYFVSPLHRKIISKALGLEEEKGVVLRPLIDTKKFYNRYNNRDIENLFVGVLSEAKGLRNMEKMYSDKTITLIGKSGTNRAPKFGKWLGEINYKEVPEYMNRSKNFVFKPRWPEPQGRVVVEAALCGCNLIINENVGAISFEFEVSKAENLENAKEEFWNNLEYIL
ncbi:MAG: glycosyltransferase, partial [SAR202 cluster bacterium]|nr:glycosyltransferase [SAR202 cluster bacterium]